MLAEVTVLRCGKCNLGAQNLLAGSHINSNFLVKYVGNAGQMLFASYVLLCCHSTNSKCGSVNLIFEHTYPFPHFLLFLLNYLPSSTTFLSFLLIFVVLCDTIVVLGVLVFLNIYLLGYFSIHER